MLDYIAEESYLDLHRFACSLVAGQARMVVINEKSCETTFGARDMRMCFTH